MKVYVVWKFREGRDFTAYPPSLFTDAGAAMDYLCSISTTYQVMVSKTSLDSPEDSSVFRRVEVGNDEVEEDDLPF